ncbi:ACT domain-containing protein, partial [Cronobacter sakazakii]|uniref:ACT domain-containing protein n=1 Tax=Cronobacter sakazakii TaxID=28141 RepID=UPI0023D80F4E
NIEDSRLAMLGDEFTFIMLLSGTWNAITLIESTLPLKGAELDLLIVMKRTSDRPRPAMPATVWVQVEVADSPHLIERFTALFNDIVHAIMNHARATEDKTFLFRDAAPVLVETARMWADLGFWRINGGREFHIHGVTGPDEYTTVVNNN